MSPEDARRTAVADRLAALLSNYTIAMPASQRLFLMEELRTVAPTVRLPTYAAERLAADYLHLVAPRIDGTDLQSTRLPGVWQLASPGGRVLALYDETTIQAIHRALLNEHQSGSVRFTILRPAETPNDDDEASAIGPVLPGWQASFTLLDSAALDAPLKARRASYIWIAVLGLGVLAVVTVSIGHTMRRQMRLARLKTDLVAAVSHELRTPLASMGLLVDGLRQDATLDPQKTREYLDLMAVENARLSRLIDNVLTFSRLDRRRLRLTFERTDAAQIVESAAEAMRSRLHPDCELQVDIAAGLPPIDADVDALVTALLNLLDNAYKYTPQEKHITLRATAEGGDVVFAVQDNGLGIPAAEQTRIFRPFYRVDRRLTRHTTGVGLGLSIVNQIVLAHGGSIRVTSEAGTGSTFSLRLPQASGAGA
jgi:signal transduction histidine kinase